MEQILIYAMFSIIWSLLCILQNPANDTLREVIVWTSAWACIPLAIAMMLHDMRLWQNFISWVSLAWWYLWSKFMTKIGKEIMIEISEWLKRVIQKIFK